MNDSLYKEIDFWNEAANCDRAQNSLKGTNVYFPYFY